MIEFVLGTGVWVTEPTELKRAFPYLRLLRTPPDKPGLPAYHFETALAADLNAVDEGVEQEDNYLEAANELVFQPPAPRFRLRTRQPRLAVKLPNRINPPILEPVLTVALGDIAKDVGVAWAPSDLTQARRDERFTTLETPAPAGEVDLELNGATHSVPASGFVAAGLRLALVETARIADFRNFGAEFDGRH